MEEIHRWGKVHGKDTELSCPLQPSTWFSPKLPIFTNSKAHQTPLFWGFLVSSLHLHDWLSHWKLMTELNLQTLSPPRRKSCLTLFDTTECSMPGFPVHHQLPEFTQTHVHQVSNAIQPSHPLSTPSPPAFNLSQHQRLFKWVSSSHQVAKVLEFHIQLQSFQWIFRTDFL